MNAYQAHMILKKMTKDPGISAAMQAIIQDSPEDLSYQAMVMLKRDKLTVDEYNKAVEKATKLRNFIRCLQEEIESLIVEAGFRVSVEPEQS